MPRLSRTERRQYERNYFWLFGRFRIYAEENGLKLLDDDLFYLADMLDKIPRDLHKTMMRDYVAKWVMLLGECESATQAQNLGRRAANLWLANQVEKEALEEC